MRRQKKKEATQTSSPEARLPYGDAKRVSLARSAPPVPEASAANISAQATLDGSPSQPPSRAPTKQSPIGFVRHDIPEATGETALTPARETRAIAACRSPNGATVHAGTASSPHALQKPRGLLAFRMGDVAVHNSISLRLFGAARNPDIPYMEPLGAGLSWDHEKFQQFKQMKRFTDKPRITTSTLVITYDSILENERKIRGTKQDDIMKHTAISHMRDRDLNEVKIKWQWGHLIPFTLKAEDPAKPENLMVVSPAANMYESRITAGLKKALHIRASLGLNLGRWELEVTADRMKVTNTTNGKNAYLKHVSHKQLYKYTYVDPTGKRHDPLEFTLHPLDPNETSYHQSTDIFSNLFSAAMQGKSFSASTQRTLDFTPAKIDAVEDQMGAAMETEVPLQSRKRKPGSNEQAYLDAVRVNITPERIKEYLAEQIKLPDDQSCLIKSLDDAMEVDKEFDDFLMDASPVTLKKTSNRPVVYIRDTGVELSPGYDSHYGDPIFVIEHDESENALIMLEPGQCPLKILEAIAAAEPRLQAWEIENAPRKSARTSVAKKTAKKEAAAASVSEKTTHPALQHLKFQTTPGDGHCFYHAVGLYLDQDYRELREAVAVYIEQHKAEFRGAFTNKEISLEQYIEKIRTTNVWADNIEIEALQRITGRPVIIIRPNANPTIPDNIDTTYQNKEPIFVFYNDSTHYDALLKIDDYNSFDTLREIRAAIQRGENVWHPGGDTGEKSTRQPVSDFFKPKQRTSASEKTPILATKPRTLDADRENLVARRRLGHTI